MVECRRASAVVVEGTKLELRGKEPQLGGWLLTLPSGGVYSRRRFYTRARPLLVEGDDADEAQAEVEADVEVEVAASQEPGNSETQCGRLRVALVSAWQPGLSTPIFFILFYFASVLLREKLCGKSAGADDLVNVGDALFG